MRVSAESGMTRHRATPSPSPCKSSRIGPAILVVRGRTESRLRTSKSVGERGDPSAVCFYNRLLARSKPKMAALIAVARKLLVVLNAVLRTSTPWTEAKHVQPSI